MLEELFYLLGYDDGLVGRDPKPKEIAMLQPDVKTSYHDGHNLGSITRELINSKPKGELPQ